jgi:hypothetical protein
MFPLKKEFFIFPLLLIKKDNKSIFIKSFIIFNTAINENLKRKIHKSSSIYQFVGK